MMRSENILLLGMGGMGEYLARRLTHEGHHVTVIEADPDKIAKADAAMDARLIRGDATSFECWTEAEADKMDYLIAVTDDDAVNIVAALIGDRFGISQKIARSRQIEVWRERAPLHAKHLNIDLVIRPEELTAQEIYRLLKTRAGNMLVDVGEGFLQVLAIHIDHGSPIIDMSIREMSERFTEFTFRVGCATRGIETIIPGADFVMQTGDHIYIVARSGDMPSLMKTLGVEEESRQRVLIIGGGMIGARVAELLESDFHVTLIEQNERRAEALSHQFKKTQCLHGDGSNRDTLLHGGLLKADTIVAATGDNETNIMTSVLAKHLIQNGDNGGQLAAKTIAVVKREEYLVLASTMGTDIAVNKKVLAANTVLRYIRRGRVLSVAHLHGCNAEVVEILAAKDSPITKKPLAAQDSLRGRIMIGAVARESGWEIAVGNTHIQDGNRVVCICAEKHLGELQRLFLS